MPRVLFAPLFLCVFCGLQGVAAQTLEPEDTPELMNEIRRDKFDRFLPEVMRANDVDMWIHVIRPWATDPLAYEFGGEYGVFVFTNRGGDRIERVVLGGEVEDPGAYDQVSEPSRFLEQQDHEVTDYLAENPDVVLDSELDLRFMGLDAFVADRQPDRIAVNFAQRLSLAEGSEVRPLTDGISHTDYVQLMKVLGPDYADRVVSAEHLIVDYLARRTEQEIAYHSLMGLRARETLDRAFDGIVLGQTTLRDLINTGPANVFLRLPDGTELHGGDEVPHVLEGGDLVIVLMGAGDMTRIMDADTSAIGYVLRDDETQPPPEVQKGWAESMRVREILEETIRAGTTGRQALEHCIAALEEAGFFYNPRDTFDTNADPHQTQVHLDLHAMGKGVIAPRISPLGPRWHADAVLPLNHTFTFEYMVHMPVPEWGPGQHLYLAFHDGVMLTENGVEYPYPADQELRVIGPRAARTGPQRAGGVEPPLITGIHLGTTNTKLHLMDGSSVSDYDLRVSVTTREEAGDPVRWMTVRTASGERFTVERSDGESFGDIDPQYGVEVNRNFESEGEHGVWHLSVIANPEYERFGDGTYTITVGTERRGDAVALWYGVPGSSAPLPFPSNNGFTAPGWAEPIENPVTFTWEADPIAQSVSVYFAGEGEERSDDLLPTVTSFGPHDYPPGYLELELAISVERHDAVDGVELTLTKGTVFSAEGTVQ